MQTAATLPPAGGTALAQPQPLPPLRDELKIHPAGNNRDGSPAWHLADPVRNLYFRLGWLELEMLRRWPLGAPQAIADSISQETTMTVDEQDVLQFLGFLQQQQLLRRGAFKARGSLWRRILHGYLFIRLPLVRPEKALRRMLPWVEWLFSAPFLLLTAVAALAGVVLAARQWDNVEAALHGALSWNGALAFAVALILSKCWHELGHAFMATRYGVRVGHMGVALLVMWPMPYTDTGESWKLERSRHRFAIASAGICAELMLAAWCTFLWTFMPDGNFRNALFFLATTAWVLTLLVNASPFGNGTSIFTRSGGAARHYQHAVEVGQVGINVPIPVPVPLFSFTGSRASKLGDLGPYGKQVVLFYTQTKTVTSRWFDDAAAQGRIHTTISLR